MPKQYRGFYTNRGNPGNRGNYSNHYGGRFLLLWLYFAMHVVQGTEINLQVNNCTNGHSQLRSINCRKGFDILANDINVHILQRTSKYVVPAIKCEILETTHRYYCGTYGHVHVAASAQHERPIMISSDECLMAYKSGFINYRGNALHIDPNHKIRHTFIVNGSITFTDGIHGLDPVCEGKGLRIDGTWVPYSFMDTEVHITVKEISLLQTKDGCMYKDEILNSFSKSKFSKYCTGPNLMFETAKIVILNNTETNKRLLSGFRTVKVLSGDIIGKAKFGDFQDKEHELKIFYEPKQMIALVLKDRIEFRKFLPELYYYATNIEEIFIWVTLSKEIYFPWIHTKETDYVIENKVFQSFNFYENLIEGNNACITDRLALSNIVTLHNTMVKRNLGEIEVQIFCKPQIVNIANLQNIHVPCFLNHFTLKINTTLFGVTPQSRTLVNSSNLITVDCDTHPTYLRLDHITYVTNVETGLKFIKVENQGNMEYSAQSFYTTVVGDFSKKPFIVTNMEKLELINLANTATEFHVKIVEAWYLHWYNKVAGWISLQWNKILFYLAIFVGVIFVLFCVVSLWYLTCCADVWGKGIRKRERQLASQAQQNA